MQLKLKENPREWLKFTVVMAVAAAVIAVILNRRGIIDRQILQLIGIVLVFTLMACSARPRWFRGFYRAGMTASFHIGQVMGRVLLTLFFLLAVTPLGWLLRLCGKDILHLKRNRSAASYWQPAKSSTQFDRQF